MKKRLSLDEIKSSLRDYKIASFVEKSNPYVLQFLIDDYNAKDPRAIKSYSIMIFIRFSKNEQNYPFPEYIIVEIENERKNPVDLQNIIRLANDNGFKLLVSRSLNIENIINPHSNELEK